MLSKSSLPFSSDLPPSLTSGESSRPSFAIPPIATSTPTRVADPTITAAGLQLYGGGQTHDLETTTGLRVSAVSDVTTVTTVTKTDVPTQRNSSGSELTNITTTDISSHGDGEGEDGEEEEEEEEGGKDEGAAMRGHFPPLSAAHGSGYSPALEASKGEGAVALSDVIVSVPSSSVLDAPPTTTTAVMLMNGHTDSDDDSPPPPPPTSSLQIGRAHV